MEKIALLKSKKGLSAVLCAVFSFACLKSGFTTEQTALVVGPLMAYLPIEGAIDHKKVKAAPATQPATAGA